MTSTDEIIEQLRMLAAPVEIQLHGGNGPTMGPDEMAIDFSLALELLEQAGLGELVGDKVAEGLRSIDGFLKEQSGSDPLWADDALHTDPRWDEVRQKARQVLSDMGVPWKMPNCSAGFLDGKMQPGFSRPPIPEKFRSLVERL